MLFFSLYTYFMENIEQTNLVFSFTPMDVEQPFDDVSLWRKIEKSLRNIVNRRFADNVKHGVKMYTDRLAIACPYCGDSVQSPSKKRGNIFLDSANFHCFNGSCDAHVSVVQLLKDYGELNDYNADELMYLRRKNKESNNSVSGKKIRIFQSVDNLFSEEAMNLTVSREYFVKTLRLQEIRGSRIQRYLEQRLQKDFHKFAFDPKTGQLYVMNLTADGTRILGFQIKTFNKKAPYITYKASKVREYVGLSDGDPELLEKLDTISTTFGIMNIDLGRYITVFEGPLDSFIFPNSVGVCSAKNDFPFEIDEIRYFYDNDKTGKEWAMKKMNEGYPVFLWKKFIEENELYEYASKIKDLNDLLIMIKRHNLKIKPLVNYFSGNAKDDESSRYDIIWI